ncbi:MAG: CDP-alcohol phosphatidyltransferase family protein [Promethearchaeota archaeon]
MPSKFRIRGVFRPVVMLVARVCTRIGLTPNHATSIMLVLSSIAFIYLLLVPLAYLTILIFGFQILAIGIMDGVDGAIARIRSMKTRFGGIFDSFSDRISDALIFFAPALRDLIRQDLITNNFSILIPINQWDLIPFWIWCVLVMIGGYMTSYVRSRSTLADNTIDMDVGLLGRSERLFILLLGSVFAIIPITIIILALLTNGTAIYRLYHAKKCLDDPGRYVGKQSKNKNA